jgi:signal transduction histidine kinase
VFIVQEAEHLARHNGGSESAADIATAARRALDDSRGAISALVRPTDEPLADALARVAQETAGRWGSAVDAHVAVGVELPPSTREALLRIVGEAVANAARHGRARRIRVDLAECPKLELRIADDGVGFDPASLDERSGRHGISGMRERAERVGGQLRVESRPGEGTQVVVVLP